MWNWYAGAAGVRGVHGAGLPNARHRTGAAFRSGRTARPASPPTWMVAATAIQVLTVADGRVVRASVFADLSVFEVFGLPDPGDR